MIKFIILKLAKLISFFSPNVKIKFLNNLIKELNECDSKYFYTFNYREKFFKEKKIKIRKNTSIIIQGPILKKDNFIIYVKMRTIIIDNLYSSKLEMNQNTNTHQKRKPNELLGFPE